MGVVNKMLLVAKEYNLRKSAPTSASIRGKRFGTRNLFKVREIFPADLRRFSQIEDRRSFFRAIIASAPDAQPAPRGRRNFF